MDRTFDFVASRNAVRRACSAWAAARLELAHLVEPERIAESARAGMAVSVEKRQTVKILRLEYDSRDLPGTCSKAADGFRKDGFMKVPITLLSKIQHCQFLILRQD